MFSRVVSSRVVSSRVVFGRVVSSRVVSSRVVQYLVKFKCHFSWQAQYFVKW